MFFDACDQLAKQRPQWRGAIEAIDGLLRENQEQDVTEPHLQRFVDASERTVSNIVNELESLGLITLARGTVCPEHESNVLECNSNATYVCDLCHQEYDEQQTKRVRLIRVREQLFVNAPPRPKDGPDFDVFLAHSSEDKVQVKSLADELTKQGLRPWLDSEQIRPGQMFHDVIQQAVGNVRSFAICIGPSGLGKWQSLELKAAVSQCINKGIPVIPVLLPGVESVPDELPFLGEFSLVRFIESIRESDNILLLVWGITGEDPERGNNGETQVSSPARQEAATVWPSLSAPDAKMPGRSGRVLFALHGIRTHAGWNRALYEVASENAWQVRADRWNFGYFSTIQFLLPWARSAKVRWFRGAYREEIRDKSVLLDKDQHPSVIAHSFGTYILGNALLKYDWLRFNKVVLCGSILPREFPWDKLIERGQVQEVRNEFGVHDIWSSLVDWFVAGTGASGQKGFNCEHARLKQEQFEYTHSEYFDKGHMEAKWLPFLSEHVDPIPAKSASVQRPKARRPWAMYAIYAILLFVVGLIVWKSSSSAGNGNGDDHGNSSDVQPSLPLTLEKVIAYEDSAGNYSIELTWTGGQTFEGVAFFELFSCTSPDNSKRFDLPKDRQEKVITLTKAEFPRDPCYRISVDSGGTTVNGQDSKLTVEPGSS